MAEDDGEEGPERQIPPPMTEEECAVMREYEFIRENLHTNITRREHLQYTYSHYTLTVEGDALPCNCRQDTDGNKCADDDCRNVRRHVACSSSCGPICGNQPWNPNNQHTFVGPTRSHIRYVSRRIGYGLFASLPIRRYEWFQEYVGEVMSVSDPRAFGSYNYDIPMVGQLINSEFRGNRTRCINHSCDPNLLANTYIHQGLLKIVLYAIRDIKPGEEITLNYKFVYGRQEKPHPCYCGAPNCTGIIGAYKVLAKDDSGQVSSEEGSCTSSNTRRGPRSKNITKSVSSEASTIVPFLYSSYLQKSAGEVKKLLQAATTAQPAPRPNDFVETHVFRPLETVYFIVSVHGTLRVIQGRVHESFTSSTRRTTRVFYFYTIRVGNLDYHMPRWLVFRYEEDAMSRLNNNWFSEQDKLRIREYAGRIPSDRDARMLVDELTNDYAMRFEAEVTRGVQNEASSAKATRHPTNKSKRLETPSSSDIVSVSSTEPLDSPPRSIPAPPAKQMALRKTGAKKTLGLKNTGRHCGNQGQENVAQRPNVVVSRGRDDWYDPNYRRPLRDVLRETENELFLDRLLSVAADNIAELAFSRVPPEQGIAFFQIRSRVEQYLRQQYFHNSPRLRRFMNFDHYRLHMDNYAPGSFHLRWCSLCGLNETFADAIQEWRHYQEFHSIVSAEYECTNCGDLFNLPSLFRQHVADCSPALALGLCNDLPDYIMDALSDFIAMQDGDNQQLYVIPPGVPRFREVEDTRSHLQGGSSTQSKNPIKMNLATKLPTGSTVNLPQVKLALQKAFERVNDWTFNDPSSNPRTVENVTGSQAFGQGNTNLLAHQRLPDRFNLDGLVVDGEVPGTSSGSQQGGSRSIESKRSKRKRDPNDPEEAHQGRSHRTRSKPKLETKQAAKARDKCESKSASGRRNNTKEKRAKEQAESDEDQTPSESDS